MPSEPQAEITGEPLGRYFICLKCKGIIQQEFLMYCDRCFEKLAKAVKRLNPDGYGKHNGGKDAKRRARRIKRV